MRNESLKMVSVRIEEDTIRLLDEFAMVHPYWSRSDFVRLVLKGVLAAADAGQLFDIMRYAMGARGCDFSVKFKSSEKSTNM